MLEILLELLAQLRILHWQADTYVQHKVFGDLYESLDSKVDELVETRLGMDSKKYVITDTELVVDDIKRVDIDNFLNSFISVINDIKTRQPIHTNIVDSMVDDINKSKYLLKLK